MHFKDKVVYQIYPKSFKDTTGNGLGDLRGIISKLDYLAELGVGYIWMCPIYPSPQYDNGYDVADYCAINPDYGTMEDFEELCREAKARGIDIMLDMVFNHTSTFHPWFQKALAGEKKYQAYYFFRDAKADGSLPNNWQSKFGGPAWEFAESVGKYYLHLYDVTQADLDWTNPEVRAELANVIKFWMSKGVASFRFDVVNLISKGSFADDPNNFDGRQFYTDGPYVHQYLVELNQNSFGQNPESYTVGEMSSTNIANCVKYAGANTHELSSVFSFHHLKVDYKNKQKWELMDFDFLELKAIFNEWQVGMQEADAWNALFWNNHDQPRANSRFGDVVNYPYETATMLATALHGMRGTPYVYQGEEFGMTNAYFDQIEQYKDVESTNFFQILKDQGVAEEQIYQILQERSRDNSRTPMQWDDSEFAGFSSTTPWIEVNKNYKQVNAAQALADKNSIFYFYQDLIRLRKELPVMQTGLYRALQLEHPEVYAYLRENAEQEMLVVTNFYPRNTSIDLTEVEGNWTKVLANYPDTEFSKELSLRPYEAVIFIRNK